MRYVNLSAVQSLSMVSIQVKERYPTPLHLIKDGKLQFYSRHFKLNDGFLHALLLKGLMLHSEEKRFHDLNAKSLYAKYWVPLVWAGSIVATARKKGEIQDDLSMKTLMDELCAFRAKCGSLISYDWVPIPLVYTQVKRTKGTKWKLVGTEMTNFTFRTIQVVTLAVYAFFLATLMGSQLIGDEKDFKVPVFAFLQVDGSCYFDHFILVPSLIFHH